MRKATDLQNNGTAQGYLESHDLCARAMEIDPEWAAVYTCFAWTYYGFISPLRDPPRAIEFAKKAVALDPTDMGANNLLAFEEMFVWNFAAAEARLQRVLEANPNHTYPNEVYWRLLLATNRPQEALEKAAWNADREPVNVYFQASLTSALFSVGDLDGAVEAYRRTLAAASNATPDAHRVASFLFQLVGREEEALQATIRAFPNIDPAGIRSAYDQGGLRSMNLYVADSWRARGACQPWSLAQAGERERLYECLERRLSARDYSALFNIRARAAFGEYWDEPEFQDLLSAVDRELLQAASEHLAKAERAN